MCNKNRSSWIDLARTCAIILVVLCHSLEIYYRPVLIGEEQVNGGIWFFENLFYTMGRMGVPLFLAITGALFLDRNLEVKQFYKKSLLSLVIATEIWIVLNYLFTCIFQGIIFNIFNLLREMLFLKASSLSHMWYMPMIIGIYVAIPFLSKLMRAVENVSDFKLVYILGVLFFIILPTLNVLKKEAITFLPDMTSIIDTYFWGGSYGLYLLGGYFIACKGVLASMRAVKLYLIAGFAFLLNSLAQYYLYINHYFKTNGLYWYNDFAIFLMGLILFELLRRGFSKGLHDNYKILELLASCSFGIYLLHKPLLILSVKYLPFRNLNMVLMVGIYFVIGFGVSLLLLLPFKYRWKKAGKVLFLIK